MNDKQIRGRLGWLGSALIAQRGKLAGILARLKGFGSRTCTSFAMQRKFALLLEQVASEKEKELDLINEIEAIEKHHHEMKRLKKLRRAESENVNAPMKLLNEEKKKPERRSSIRILWMFYMLSPNGNKNKKQSIG